MNTDKKLQDLEKRQREIADEIAELRKKQKTKEFIPGRFYAYIDDIDTTILCISDKGRDEECFSGIFCGNFYKVFSRNEKVDDGWIRKKFYEVTPTGWKKVED